MDANMLRGHLDLILLSTLEGGPLYGLRIIQNVHQQTKGAFQFKEGTLYPALHRLEQQGLLSSEVQPSDTGGPPRKYYRLTAQGREALRRKQAEWQAFTRAMRPFGGLSLGQA
ncbi:PadR family transcriptional regulator [Deinococcus sonorensis]|uniref:Helix-turn-helix transcriptional regulator n=2 Tax=Deinococcus sonorensis TaxID=309891 RepID=A0AAU7UF63_9DEIO